MTAATKTRRIVTIPYTVGEHFAPYIANGDTEGLTEDELQDFARLEQEARAIASRGYEFAHWNITDNRDEFAQCEATDLMGATVEIEAVYFRN
jgi:hypothetical protein